MVSPVLQMASVSVSCLLIVTLVVVILYWYTDGQPLNVFSKVTAQDGSTTTSKPSATPSTAKPSSTAAGEKTADSKLVKNDSPVMVPSTFMLLSTQGQCYYASEIPFSAMANDCTSFTDQTGVYSYDNYKKTIKNVFVGGALSEDASLVQEDLADPGQKWNFDTDHFVNNKTGRIIQIESVPAALASLIAKNKTTTTTIPVVAGTTSPLNTPPLNTPPVNTPPVNTPPVNTPPVNTPPLINTTAVYGLYAHVVCKGIPTPFALTVKDNALKIVSWTGTMTNQCKDAQCWYFDPTANFLWSAYFKRPVQLNSAGNIVLGSSAQDGVKLVMTDTNGTKRFTFADGTVLAVPWDVCLDTNVTKANVANSLYVNSFYTINSDQSIDKVPNGFPNVDALAFGDNEDRDISGEDISCDATGKTAQQCLADCVRNPDCRAYNYIPPNSVWGTQSGCCIKRDFKPTSVGYHPGVHLYVSPSTLKGKGLSLEPKSYTNVKYNLKLNKSYSGDNSCIDKGNGTDAIIYDCDSQNANQIFNSQNDNLIRFKDGNQCLTAKTFDPVKGDLVGVAKCNIDDPRQRLSQNGSTGQISHTGFSGNQMCVNIKANNLTRGTPLIWWECNDDSNEKWFWP